VVAAMKKPLFSRICTIMGSGSVTAVRLNAVYCPYLMLQVHMWHAIKNLPKRRMQ